MIGFASLSRQQEGRSQVSAFSGIARELRNGGSNAGAWCVELGKAS